LGEQVQGGKGNGLFERICGGIFMSFSLSSPNTIPLFVMGLYQNPRKNNKKYNMLYSKTKSRCKILYEKYF
jgi:hypothetical protein